MCNINDKSLSQSVLALTGQHAQLDPKILKLKKKKLVEKDLQSHRMIKPALSS